MKEHVILLVHGFGGGTYEVEYLADYLKSHGYEVVMPTIYGHGTSKKDFAKSKHEQWIISIKREYIKLSKIYKKVTLIGFSMGGLISTHLATHKQVDKMVFVNCPVYFWNFPIILSDVYDGIVKKEYEKLKRYSESFNKSPIKACIEFLKILVNTRSKFEEIKKPLLIIQCTRDETVLPASAKFIYKKVKKYSKLKLYKGGCHRVLYIDNPLRDKICKDILKFLKK